MISNDTIRFKQFAESCGNNYLAIKIISKWTRELGNKFSEYRISESKLLETVLSGKCFYTEYEMMKRRSSNDDDHIEDFLSWVVDDEVVDEVKYMYAKSISIRRLAKCRRDDLTPGQLSRVNILLRMIWYSTGEEKGE